MKRFYADLARRNLRLARLKYGALVSQTARLGLAALTRHFGFSMELGDVLLLDGSWYVTHAGLLRLATRKGCIGIRVQPKAYGIGICSVEEIGTFNPSTEPAAAARKPAHSVESNGHPLRDRLYLLVRQHRLDARLVKLYAAGFCGTEDLRQATRERMQEFVEHLAAEAKNDIDALRQKLEAYQQTGEGAA